MEANLVHALIVVRVSCALLETENLQKQNASKMIVHSDAMLQLNSLDKLPLLFVGIEHQNDDPNIYLR